MDENTDTRQALSESETERESPILKPKKKLSEKQLEALAKRRAKRSQHAKTLAARKREQEAKSLRQGVHEKRDASHSRKSLKTHRKTILRAKKRPQISRKNKLKQ